MTEGSGGDGPPKSDWARTQLNPAGWTPDASAPPAPQAPYPQAQPQAHPHPQAHPQPQPQPQPHPYAQPQPPAHPHPQPQVGWAPPSAQPPGASPQPQVGWANAQPANGWATPNAPPSGAPPQSPVGWANAPSAQPYAAPSAPHAAAPAAPTAAPYGGFPAGFPSADPATQAGPRKSVLREWWGDMRFTTKIRLVVFLAMIPLAIVVAAVAYIGKLVDDHQSVVYVRNIYPDVVYVQIGDRQLQMASNDHDRVDVTRATHHIRVTRPDGTLLEEDDFTVPSSWNPIGAGFRGLYTVGGTGRYVVAHVPYGTGEEWHAERVGADQRFFEFPEDAREYVSLFPEQIRARETRVGICAVYDDGSIPCVR